MFPISNIFKWLAPKPNGRSIQGLEIFEKKFLIIHFYLALILLKFQLKKN